MVKLHSNDQKSSLTMAMELIFVCALLCCAVTVMQMVKEKDSLNKIKLSLYDKRESTDEAVENVCDCFSVLFFALFSL